MKYLTLIMIYLWVAHCSYSESCKLFCYYDISSGSKVGPAKFTAKDMELALHFCTHVIYSYVTVTSKNPYTLTALSSERESELANMHHFKNKYPNVKFLLSLSGEKNWKTTKQILNLLEADQRKKEMFIKSVMNVLKRYNFDGLSLDLPLPTEQAKPHKTFYTKMWHNFIDAFKFNSEHDAKEREHKAQLTTLIKQFSTHLKEINGLLSVNVLPNVDSRKYFDVVEINNSLDFVILSAFDFFTPEHNPKEADLMSPTKPLEESGNRLYLTNIKNLYKHWHSQNVPRYKIIIGVAAYGRAWKMTRNSNSDGKPPVLFTDGPAAAGPQTQIPGILSWPEICGKLSHDHKLTRVTDPKAKSGVYAYRPSDSAGNFGIWISYEDPITAAAKAMYVRNHNLGGVALFDVNLDDIHGECSVEKFPILRSINFKLTRFHA